MDYSKATYKMTDAEFLDLWEKYKSSTKIAQVTGLNLRSISKRRRSMENKYGKSLISEDAFGVTYDKKVNVEIENGTVIVFSDAHFWDKNPTTAYRALLKIIKELKPKLVVANGDIFDGASNSRHPSIGWQDKPTLASELEAAKDMMWEIAKVAKGAKLTWSLGNHDQRFDTYLAANANMYKDVEGFTIKDHFPEWQFAWATWVNGHTVIKHRFRGGIHATYNNTLHSGVSIVTGHLHSLKVTPFTDYNGTRYGVDTGCLADIDGNQFSDYLETNPVNWRSGFVVLTFENYRLITPEIVEVIAEGEAVFRGKVYKV